MKYRIAEKSNSEFIIQGEVRRYDLYWWFGWKKKNIRTEWYRLSVFGRPGTTISTRYLRYTPDHMPSFKSLKKAKKKIKELQTETVFHYLDEPQRP